MSNIFNLKFFWGVFSRQIYSLHCESDLDFLFFLFKEKKISMKKSDIVNDVRKQVILTVHAVIL